MAFCLVLVVPLIGVVLSALFHHRRSRRRWTMSEAAELGRWHAIENATPRRRLG